MNDEELMHYGIKGQKWGIRRFQKKDGSLTPAGKKRYDDGVNDKLSKNKQEKSNPIERHRANLVDKYKEQGYGQAAAETAANRRIQTEIFVAAAATVTVGVIATKAATRLGQDYFDKTIKSGTTIQNIGAFEDADFKSYPFFAAVNKSDKQAYGNMYALEKRGMQIARGDHNPTIYNNQIRLNQDVRVASVNKARATFEDKMKNDPSFRESVLSTMEKTNYGKQAQDSMDYYRKTGKVSKKFYDKFNQSLATPEIQEAGLHKDFYSELQKKGYNAILDINDTRYSGYKGTAKSPTIFFGDDKWEKIASTKLSDVEIESNAVNYGLKLIAKQSAKKYGTLAGAAVVGSKVSDQMAIERYLDEHPNSKLSDREILDIVRYG